MIDYSQTGLRPPTKEELEQAEAEIFDLYTKGRFYLSANVNVQAIQIKCFAYRYPLKERQTGSNTPVKSEAEFAKERLKEAITHDHEISSSIMGNSSIYANISWLDATCKQTQVVTFLKNMAKNGSKACLLLGGTGAGKTHGSICFVSRYAENKDQVLFYTAYKVSELVNRRAFNETDRLETVKYLIIDDLGVSPEGYKGSDFVAFFENLFTTRHQKGRYTLITSNASPEQIKQVYGERFVSRFKEIGEIFITGDPDMRAKEGIK